MDIEHLEFQGVTFEKIENVKSVGEITEKMIETFESPEIPKLPDGRCDNDKTDVKSDVLK